MAQLQEINQCFSSNCVEQIHASLASSPSQWSSKTLAELEKCAT